MTLCDKFMTGKTRDKFMTASDKFMTPIFFHFSRVNKFMTEFDKFMTGY